MENASDDSPQQKKLENLLPNFNGSSPPIRRKLRQLYLGTPPPGTEGSRARRARNPKKVRKESERVSRGRRPRDTLSDSFRTLLGFRARRAREPSVPGGGVPKTLLWKSLVLRSALQPTPVRRLNLPGWDLKSHPQIASRKCHLRHGRRINWPTFLNKKVLNQIANFHFRPKSLCDFGMHSQIETAKSQNPDPPTLAFLGKARKTLKKQGLLFLQNP